VKGKYFQKINETIISEPGWAKDHWATIKQFYSKARYFKDYKDIFEHFYLNTQEQYLSKVNYEMIKIINEILGIKTKISWSSDYHLVDGKTERLLSLVQQAGGSEYISGPAAKGYIIDRFFSDAGITLSWMEYSGYPEYEQLYPPFEHGVTVQDLIFNEGPNAIDLLKRNNHGA
jgi:hypothetical protein